MIHLYKAQFFYAFRIREQTFELMRKKMGSAAGRCMSGSWFEASPPIRPYKKETFAEYAYFHPHVRELLFSRDDEPSALLGFRTKKEHIRDWYVGVSYRRERDEPAVTHTRLLELTGINMMLYDLDIGILSIEVAYDARSEHRPEPAPNFDDILDINNILRRSAPAYINTNATANFSEVQASGTDLATAIWYQKTAEPQAEPIVLENFGASFDQLLLLRRREEGTAHLPYYLSNHISFWLKQFAKDMGLQEEAFLEPILDDRGFITTFVMLDSSDSGRFVNNSSGIQTQGTNPFGSLDTEGEAFRVKLYQYIYTDPSSGPTIANRSLRDRLLTDALYLRYREYGSYYGFTRYGGAYLLHGENGFSRYVLGQHFESMYFQMANLLILFRAALLEQSRRAAHISMQARTPEKLWKRRVQREVNQLRADFLRFQSRYWFAEVTAQEQGIEMFNLWSTRMENDRLFTEVEKEIGALHEFSLSMINRRLSDLTYINVSALVIAIFAIAVNMLDFDIPGDLFQNIFGTPGAVVLAILLSVALWLCSFFIARNWFEGRRGRTGTLIGRLKNWWKDIWSKLTGKHGFVRIWIVPANDGEAVEIIKLLEKRREECVLRSEQGWGASWDRLEEELVEKLDTLRTLAKRSEVFGIELAGEPRWNGKNIDHHRYAGDDRSHKLSSLEQVAKILGVKLDDRQKLVAANDRGHIRAMRAMGATDEEIADIRDQDRRAQGLTDKHKEQAERDIANLKVYGTAAIVECPDGATAWHTDLLEGRYAELLTISPKTWVYYGHRIAELHAMNLPEQTWSGGEADRGYFGIREPGEKTGAAMRQFMRQAAQRAES